MAAWLETTEHCPVGRPASWVVCLSACVTVVSASGATVLAITGRLCVCDVVHPSALMTALGATTSIFLSADRAMALPGWAGPGRAAPGLAETHANLCVVGACCCYCCCRMTSSMPAADRFFYLSVICSKHDGVKRRRNL